MMDILSKLPAPRAADWGFGVTIGIGVMCDLGAHIVTVSDQKVDFGSYAADYAALKTIALVGNEHDGGIDRIWHVLIAGNDTEYADPIIDRARKLLRYTSVHPVETIVEALDMAFAEATRKEIEHKVLTKRGFTAETFMETGRRKCGASVDLSRCQKIDQVKLSLKFLLCGFDEAKHPHLYEINGETQPKCYDSIGMWAIGSGAYSAMSCLSYYVNKDGTFYTRGPGAGLFFALGAKFMAESSGDVGTETFAEVHSYGDIWFVEDETVKGIRKIWEAEAALRVPSDLENRVSELRKKSS
jgi:hypothetical protein